VGRLIKVVVFVVVLAVAAAGVAVAANRIGDNNANTLTGTNNADAIYGLGSRDTLKGLDGNDEISGNGGADTMNGGAGYDVMVGGPGGDNINTGTSPDTPADDGLEDFVYAFDGFADTVCFGPGDPGFVIFDGDLDTILEGANCETVLSEPSAAAATQSGNGAVTLSIGE
jgi:RTX calcium-binding nonapeptide repeat (4 copies)